MAIHMTTSSGSPEFDLPKLKVTAGSWSRQGRNRDQNEDREYVSPAMDLFIVADGMGGHQRGEIASRFAIDALTRALVPLRQSTHTDDEIEDAVRAALEEANCLVLDLSSAGQRHRLPGTTVVMALLFGSKLFVTGVGDSRAYLLRNGTMEVLTEDDTVAAFLVKRGTISIEAARTHPARHQLLQSIGMPDFKPDQSIQVLEVMDGDRLLLCSDGISDVVPDSEIVMALESEHDPRRAAKELVDLAVWHGAKDDCTCILLKVDRERAEVPAVDVQPERQPLFARIRSFFVQARVTG